jgi:tetraacyldisaccharide 4'-kinase
VRNAAYQSGLLRARVVPARTVSIGNVRVGGTGKTPLTRWLAMAARARGASVAIVSRGYGGSERTPHIVGDGVRVRSDVAASGDEAVMLARTSGVPVVAGRDRVAAARLAIDTFGARLLLCDDAFQHRRLERDLDLVLVDADEAGGLGRVLPAGPLREPLGAIARADVVLVREAADAGAGDPPARAGRRVRFAPTALVVPGTPTWEERPLGLLAEKRVLAVSGVARPAALYASLHDWSAELTHVLEYPDHHVYDTRAWKEIAQLARNVDLVVTTEKDLVKLEAFPFARDALVAIRLGVEVDDAEALVEQVLGMAGG